MNQPLVFCIKRLPGKTSLVITALFSLLISAAPGNAADLAAHATLFTAQVKVASQSTADLNRALPKAFDQALGRLTANPAISNQPWARRASSKARNYLNQYRYETHPQAGRPPSSGNSSAPDQPPPPEEQVYLISEFNVEAVTALLEQNGIAFWSGTRPTLVAWLLHDQGRNRHIVDSDNTDLGKLIQQTSHEFGLDLVLPLMDLQEQRQVTPSHLWLRDTALLANATSRYNTRVFLLGQLHTLADDRATANWLLSIDGTEYQWHHQQPLALKAQLRQGFNAISKQLFQLYSHHPGTTKATGRIRITQISSAQQYQRAWDYLSQLQGVASVVPVSFANGEAEFTINHRGDWNELLRLVQLGSTLVPMELPYGYPRSSGINGSATSSTQADPLVTTTSSRDNPPVYRLER